MNKSKCSLDLESEIEDDSFNEPWTINDFSFGKPLGRGRFGRVFLAKEKRTSYQCLVALKILSKKMLKETDTLENFKRECELQLSLNHPNVLRCYGWFYDERKIFLILEYAQNGNIFNRIENLGSINNNEAATIIYQTSKGLAYIHSKGIVHRDLKPENILLGNWGEVKIADFGWSNKFKNSDDSMNYEENASVAGTIDYLSPEVILKLGHSDKIDIWCLGVLCYEMLVGQAPFLAKSNEDTIDKILKVKFEVPPSVHRLARKLIIQLIVRNPEKRISLDQVIEDDWINLFADKSEKYLEYQQKN